MSLTAHNRTRVYFDTLTPIDPPTVLALDELRQAASAYHEATRRAAVLERLWDRCDRRRPDRRQAEERRWERQLGQRIFAAHQAKMRLIKLILMLHDRIENEHQLPLLGGDWGPCAVELDGRFYLVGQNPNDDDPDPFLFVVEQADIFRS